MNPSAPSKPRRRISTSSILIAVLAATTVVASTGWLLAARDGRGIPVDCYTLEGGNVITFDAPHGNATHRSRFTVAETDDTVMLGHWEESEGGTHTMEAHAASVRFLLVKPLGEREVVDPAGESIPSC